MPASSKTGPPLAKAKPISTSVITYLRSRKTLRERELLQPERGVRRCKKLCRHQDLGGLGGPAVTLQALNLSSALGETPLQKNLSAPAALPGPASPSRYSQHVPSEMLSY
ncbi:hypothetical protein GRJ2_000348400 [Grus japonensis]|uniref:Uncharacterized protein n=1 Tax=Grus japonensis TaxID=30415 RepID=A0ABC9W0F4_GRUJA